jgi:putative membrane protein
VRCRGKNPVRAGPKERWRLKDRVALSMIGLVSSVVVIAVGFLLVGRQPQMGAVPNVSALPAVNAWLNATSAVLLTAGYGFIRQRRVSAHKTCMLTAFGVSSCFLVSYVIYHYHAGSKPFGGHGWIRGIYYPLLISHVVLAALIVPFALTTIYRAWRGEFARHRRIARWTLPVWLYVSVTGVIVYWMLYHLGP